MDAKQRPPRKFFFSPRGTPTPVKLKFLSEPNWKQTQRGEALTALVSRNDSSPEELEQFTPDAYDLSQALVTALGGTVDGKTCLVEITTKEVASKRSPTGKASVIDKFIIKAV